MLTIEKFSFAERGSAAKDAAGRSATFGFRKTFCSRDRFCSFLAPVQVRAKKPKTKKENFNEQKNYRQSFRARCSDIPEPVCFNFSFCRCCTGSTASRRDQHPGTAGADGR